MICALCAADVADKKTNGHLLKLLGNWLTLPMLQSGLTQECHIRSSSVMAERLQPVTTYLRLTLLCFYRVTTLQTLKFP